MSSHFDSIAALLNLAANCSIDWPNRPCKSDRHRFQLWSNHNLLRSVASSKYPCSTMTFDDASSAIKKGDVLRLRHYLDSGLDPNLPSGNGDTLLMRAAFAGNTAMARELIYKSAHLDVRDKHNWTALAIAAHKGHPECGSAASSTTIDAESWCVHCCSSSRYRRQPQPAAPAAWDPSSRSRR